MSNSTSKLLAAAMLALMLGLAFYSLRGDSAIMDELAHLPAGYSYVTQHDMRINPEHPPLIKDLAGLSVILAAKINGIPIKFPSQIKAWTQDINGQWDFGSDFMYKEGNPADFMLFWGRLPMLLILLILGIYVFIWARRLWGNWAGLLALFFYAFSPTFLAHGRFVTTDVAASAAIFIASYYFIHYLKKPNALNLILAGIIFGVAQLAKFSVFLLVPFFVILTIVWIMVALSKLNKNRLSKETPPPAPKLNLYEMPKFREEPESEPKKENWLKISLKYILGLVVVFLIGYIFIVTPVYYFHVKNYPPEKQKSDTEFILNSYGGGPPAANESILSPCTKPSRISRCPAQLAIFFASSGSGVGRAFGQYLLGLDMVLQRAAGGNTTFFMGQVSAAGWKSYFPILYALKEPLALHILTLIAVILAIFFLFKRGKTKSSVEKNEAAPPPENKLKSFWGWVDKNFDVLAMLGFIALYWGVSLRSPLNIGVRHILPTFAFIYVLVAGQIVKWLKIQTSKIIKSIKYVIVILLLIWQAATIFAIYPSFLAYFNELGGGPKNGYKYAADSNLDWGQDLKRLAVWTEQNNIQKIYVDYFGGGDAKYYLGDKLLPWWGDRNPTDLKSGDWLAVSATFLQGGRGKPVSGFSSPTGYYDWLNNYQPVTTIGYSIFVYQMP